MTEIKIQYNRNNLVISAMLRDFLGKNRHVCPLSCKTQGIKKKKKIHKFNSEIYQLSVLYRIIVKISYITKFLTIIATYSQLELNYP